MTSGENAGGKGNTQISIREMRWKDFEVQFIK
jgi:hypothetical protein